MLLTSVIAYAHYFFLFKEEYSKKSTNVLKSKPGKKTKLSLSELSIKHNKQISIPKDKIDDFTYCLPFRPGNSYYVSQTQGRTHKGKSKHAIDFLIPIGAGVHAARSGYVINAQDIFSEAGRTQEFLGKANYIVIKHSDMTNAMYAHLDYKGTKVKVGDYVKVGDHIGYAGNTGFSNGAHLHFEVFKGFGRDQRSFEVSFMTNTSLKEKLVSKKRYRANKHCTKRREDTKIAR